MDNLTEDDFQWRSGCCFAAPADPPGDVDEYHSAFCSRCGEGSGFMRVVGLVAGFATKHGGVDYMMLQKDGDVFVTPFGVDDMGEVFYLDDEKNYVKMDKFMTGMETSISINKDLKLLYSFLVLDKIGYRIDHGKPRRMLR